ncbi:MAG: TolC family protein [Candidatus Zixiibacteriota bacterium]|nr:MAG: TolC family protein [candidate division Zixibacteria bacterium]
MPLIITVAAVCILAVAALAETPLTLKQAIELSLDHSYGIKSARHDSAAAVYDHKAAGSQRLPTLSLEALSYYIDEIPSIEFPFVGEKDLGVKDNYQADFRLSLPLFTGGKISSQIRMTGENRQVKSFALEAQQLYTAYNCRKAYLRLMLARVIVSSAEASTERIRIIRQDVDNLYINGVADSVDILEAELAYRKALLMLSEKKTGEMNAASVLKQILGLPRDADIQPIEEIPIPENSTKETQSSISRPELRMLDSRKRVAEYLSRLNKADYFPSLSGFVGYSVGKPNRDFFNNEWNDNLIAGAALSWQLNLGGRTHHGIQSAKQAAFSAQMSKMQLEESLTTAADIALQNINLAYETFVTSQKEHEIARDKYRLGKNKQKEGYLTVNRLLEMEAELTAAEQLFRASMISYQTALTGFLYAIGSDRIYGGL